MVVSVAVTIGFIRVYDTWSFLVALLAFALGAHALAIATRRRATPGLAVVGLAIGGAAVAVGWILFPSTTAWGIPTTATWTAAVDSLTVARDRYPVVIAPTDVLPGFQLAAGLALWVAAWFADWTAHRLRATAEALAPTTAVFVFCAVLGSGRYEVACTAAFAAAALWFVAVQRSASLERDQAWLPTNRVTARAVLRSASVVAVVAVFAGAVIGPRLPGAQEDAAVSWRESKGGDSSRVTVSPMVELKKRLVDQSDREMFEVQSSERAYWRLTSLDVFDGEIWSSSGHYKAAGTDLPSEEPAGQPAHTITQKVKIKALSAIWAPSAFEAVSVRSTDQPLHWDPDSSTLIVDSSQPTSDGLTYTVLSRTPNIERAKLESAGATDPQAITDTYLGLPSDFPFYASDLARAVTRGAVTRYEKARALQDWFRTQFNYSLDTKAGHGDDALVSFLQSGEGYCEQFAGAYAAMARSLDIPARVAVGFTPGNEDPDDPDVYHVLGRHAHAWPEVYFPGSGWVPFEPTPGRGMPGAQSYTGVAEQQDLARPITITTTSTAPPTTVTTAPGDQSRTSADDKPDNRTRTVGGPSTPGPSTTGSVLRVIALLVAAAVALGGLIVFSRRRRRAQRLAALDEADRSWARVERALARRRGLAQEPSETHLEFARRAGPELGDLALPLRVLASLVTENRWSPDALSAAETEQLHDLADQLIAGLESKAAVG